MTRVAAAIAPRAKEATTHYDAAYFEWQSRIGRFGGWANVTKFSKFIRPGFNVLDFGCGGGYLLASIACREKVGIEVNPVARAEAQRQGIRAVESVSGVDDAWADLIISNHALEHCLNPLQELRRLLPKVVPGGLIAFVLPCESVRHKCRSEDPNHHLYSWSPMSGANLFAEAGFRVLESRAYIHTWPPRFFPSLLRHVGGRNLFEAGCRLYGALTYWGLTPTTSSQIRIVAQRPASS
jgi:SAM-dependent methyltransferase